MLAWPEQSLAGTRRYRFARAKWRLKPSTSVDGLRVRSRRETMRLLGDPDDGSRRDRHVSWLTGYDDSWSGTNSYRNIGFTKGRIRYVEVRWGE